MLHGIDLAPSTRHTACGRRSERSGQEHARSPARRNPSPAHGPCRGRRRRAVAAAPDRLRREIALVTQEHHLFACSLRDNLRLASPGASDEELMAALVAVDADSSVPLSCRTVSTPGSAPPGVRLPPAFAQQVAIARLLLADPHTLVLDEATSLLDSTGGAPPREVDLAPSRRSDRDRDLPPAAGGSRRRYSSWSSRTERSPSTAHTQSCCSRRRICGTLAFLAGRRGRQMTAANARGDHDDRRIVGHASHDRGVEETRSRFGDRPAWW